MMINHSALPLHIKKQLAPVYILSGTDLYLQEQTANVLKKAFHPECETRKVRLQQASDWEHLLAETNSYSLFSEYTCVQAWLEKKTLDAAGKNALNSYLDAVNPKSLLLLQAPEMPAKQWQWLEKQDQVVIVKIVALEGNAFKNWIISQLNHYHLRYEPDAVTLLQQYTEGNQQACMQALEKLTLLAQEEILLTPEIVAEQIMNQSEWQIFDLAQACLQANAPKALQILRQAQETRMEVTLVLWVLSQEIRLLARLSFLLQKGIDFREACSQLKIWNTRISGYQQMHKRLPANICDNLLKICKNMDEGIKTGLPSSIIWQTLESLALTLCLGKTGTLAC